jgi:RNA polymerase-binding transcription factor DksA
MTRREIHRFKRVLEDLKAEAIHRLENSVGRLAISQAADPVDQMCDFGEQEMDSRNISPLTDRVRSLDVPLRAIPEGSFGRCASYGSEISKKRLEALPWSSFALAVKKLLMPRRPSTTTWRGPLEGDAHLLVSQPGRNAAYASCLFSGNGRDAGAIPGVLTVLLAGGAGERLFPLTREHAKPVLPFGGMYRIIDVTLSNCINSGLRKIYVLTQHKALSLNRHLRDAWNILPPELGEFIEILPPTKRIGNNWYLGTADALYQNIESMKPFRSC